MTTAWFVDGAYLSKAWSRVATGGERMDYAILRSEIEDDAGEVVGDAYYFNCDNDPPTAAQNGFHVTLLGTDDSISGHLAPYAANVVDLSQIKAKIVKQPDA